MPTEAPPQTPWHNQARAIMRDRRWPAWEADLTSGDPARIEKGLVSVFWWQRVQSILGDPKHAEALATIFADSRPLSDEGVEEAVHTLERAQAGTGWERDDEPDNDD